MKLFVLVVICQLFIARSLNNRDRASAKRTSILKDINSSSDNDNCRNAYSSWHKLYTAMHQKVLNGTLPARYLVSIAPHQGLADRIGTLPTHFLWALLTQRALVLATPHDVIPLSEIYDFPNLKLDLPQVLQDSSDSLTNLSYDGYPSSIDKSQRIGMNMVLNQQLGQTNGSLYRHIVKLSEVVFAKRNLSNYPLHHTDTSVFSIISNRGETWKIYNNPNHQQQLYDLGFRRPLLFHCIFSYLLSLRPQSCNAKCQEIEKSMLAVRQNHSNVIIGVQLRLGDVAAFGASPNNASSPSKHELMPSNIIEKFVLCTNRLSVEVAREQGKQPLIFVISDSRDVRRHFVEQFGENRVLTDLTSPILHSSDVNIEDNQNKSEVRAQLVAGMKGAASDMYLYSLAHFHIVSRKSGFGQKAAMLASTNTNFHVYYGDGDSCTMSKYVKPSRLVNSFSGL